MPVQPVDVDLLIRSLFERPVRLGLLHRRRGMSGRQLHGLGHCRGRTGATTALGHVVVRIPCGPLSARRATTHTRRRAGEPSRMPPRDLLAELAYRSDVVHPVGGLRVFRLDVQVQVSAQRRGREALMAERTLLVLREGVFGVALVRRVWSRGGTLGVGGGWHVGALRGDGDVVEDCWSVGRRGVAHC